MRGGEGKGGEGVAQAGCGWALEVGWTWIRALFPAEPHLHPQGEEAEPVDRGPESRYLVGRKGLGLSVGLWARPLTPRLPHPSTPEGGPSSRRQRDLNPEPEPESEEPDGGFRKVRDPIHAHDRAIHQSPQSGFYIPALLSPVLGSAWWSRASGPFPWPEPQSAPSVPANVCRSAGLTRVPPTPTPPQLYADLRSENERLREALTETTLQLAQLKVELERATQVRTPQGLAVARTGRVCQCWFSIHSIEGPDVSGGG